jgi:hypothetical protein
MLANLDELFAELTKGVFSHVKKLGLNGQTLIEHKLNKDLYSTRFGVIL